MHLGKRGERLARGGFLGCFFIDPRVLAHRLPVCASKLGLVRAELRPLSPGVRLVEPELDLVGGLVELGRRGVSRVNQVEVGPGLVRARLLVLK